MYLCEDSLLLWVLYFDSLQNHEDDEVQADDDFEVEVVVVFLGDEALRDEDEHEINLTNILYILLY